MLHLTWYLLDEKVGPFSIQPTLEVEFLCETSISLVKFWSCLLRPKGNDQGRTNQI